MRKILGLALVVVTIGALTGQPASADHAASVVAINAFAGTCGGTPYSGGPAAGSCVFGNDAIWSTTRNAVDDSPACNPGNNGGGSTSGCGQGVYLPGLGPPVVRPTTPLDVVRDTCDNPWAPRCWIGGNFINVADSSVHSLGLCVFAQSDGANGRCKSISRGSFYRPVSTIGAYSGTSEGCGRVYTENLGTGDWVVADFNWVHSGGTMLPTSGRVRQVHFDGANQGGHTGTNLFLLSNARSIAPTEPPGEGNGGITEPSDSGTRRFSVNAVSVALPGNSPGNAPVGQNADVYCPELY